MPTDNEFPLNKNGEPIHLKAVTITPSKPATTSKPRKVIVEKDSTVRPGRTIDAETGEEITGGSGVTEGVTGGELSMGEMLGIAEIAKNIMSKKKEPTLPNEEFLKSKVESATLDEIIARDRMVSPLFYQPDMDFERLAKNIAMNPTPVGVAIALGIEISSYDMMGQVSAHLSYMRENQLYEEKRGQLLSTAAQQNIAVRQTKLESEMKVLHNSLEKQVDSTIKVLSRPSQALKKKVVQKPKSPFGYRWSDHKSQNTKPIKINSGNPYVTKTGIRTYDYSSKSLSLPDTIVPESLWRNGTHLEGYVAGLIDGIYIELKGLVDIGVLGVEAAKGLMDRVQKDPSLALDILLLLSNPAAFASVQIAKNKEDIQQTFDEILDHKEELLKIWEDIKKEFGEYIDDLAGEHGDAKAGYERGKLTIVLLTFLVGYGEVKSVLKGGKLGANLVSKLKTAITKFKNLSKEGKEKLIHYIKKKSIRTTHPSLKPSKYRKPKGKPKKISKKDLEKSPANVRGTNGENEAAEVLSKNGYDIEQLPEVKGKKNPDYKIEGKIFDGYTPGKDKDARGIWKYIKDEKVDKGQADRVVVNLNHCDTPVEDVIKQFSEWRMEGLKEVLAIKNNQVIKIYP